MSSIAEKTYAEQSSIKSVSRFCKDFKISAALKSASAYKQKGVAANTITQYLIALIYTGKSMFQDMRSPKPFAQGFFKDTVYRFLNQKRVNWLAFLLIVAGRVIANIDRLTSEKRRCAFVIDDTVFQILYAKKTELVSRVYDHAAKVGSKYKWGYRMLTLGWTDGASFIPLAFRHLASSDKSKQRCGVDPKLDKRSRAYRIRKEAVSKATDVMILQLKAALRAGISAGYVLFDTWFANPAPIIKVHNMGLNVVARVRDTQRVKYLIDGEKKSASAIYKSNRKRRGKSRYQLSVRVDLYTKGAAGEVTVPAKLVYVRHRRRRKEWVALICTDMEMSEDDIIALYGKRWDIEVFFKICKSYLKLAGEFNQLSYDAITAHTTIVMLRYMILSYEKRVQDDPRTLGELFYLGCDEASDVKFEWALMLIMTLMEDVLNEADIGLSTEQMEYIMDAFIQKLPYEIRLCLKPSLAA